MLERPMRIVLIEDEGPDIVFMLKAFERGDGDFDVTTVGSGPEFFDHLRDVAAEQLPPDLVLLDLNLPGANGLEILAELRSGDTLPHVVVVVLTSSSYAREVTEAYVGGANAFVTKPARLAELDKFVSIIEDWSELFQFPYQ